MTENGGQRLPCAPIRFHLIRSAAGRGSFCISKFRVPCQQVRGDPSRCNRRVTGSVQTARGLITGILVVVAFAS
jgi:hypothetical protein